MKTRLLSSIIAICIAARPAFAFLGPSGSQVSISTNGFSQISPASATAQAALDWIDDNVYTEASGLLTSQQVANSYMSLTANNTSSSGKTNSFSAVVARDSVTIDYLATVKASSGTASCTNGGSLSIAGPAQIVTPYGRASGSTNYVVLGTPSSLGMLHILAVSSAATNALAVTNTSTMSGPALYLDAGEMAILYAVATNKWATLQQ